MGAVSSSPEEAMRVAAESGDEYPTTEFLETSLILIPRGASLLNTKELIDRIKGTIYGNCLGDAVGLATEFMSKSEAIASYGKEGKITLQNFVRDGHRSRWKEGDWTDDSDQMLLVMDGLFAHGGQISEIDFAQRLRYWTRHGFPELGDLAGLGIGATVHAVVNSKKFVISPHECAQDVWDKSNQQLAANGAVMRTSILGIPDFHDLDKVIENTKKICKTTHADPRCVASCVAVTTAIALMLQKGIPENNIKNIIEPALELARKELDPSGTGPKGREEFDRHALCSDLSELELDDEKKIGYTYKCFGSAFYCLRTGNDFKQSILELTMEAGDADTNCAVAGALLGCKLGYSLLPEDWLASLKEKPWLDKKVERLLGLLGLEE